MSETWWWGTYPEAGAGGPTGVGEGIWVMAPGGPAVRAIELPVPTFVVAHPDLPVLYAVTEDEDSHLVCLDVSDPAHPAVLDSIPTGGSGACHLMLSRDTLTAYVTHYSTGEVAVVPLRADGRIATPEPAQLLRGEGSGPVPGRQSGARAHFVGYAPTGPVLLVCDPGTDRIRRYEVLSDGSLRADGVAAQLAPGSGPRHFAVRDDVIYVTCELDHTLKALRWDPVARTATEIASTAVTDVPLRSGDSIYEAHVLAVSDVLLASVRGCDVIAVFDLGGDGIPTYRASFDSGGAFPRYFAVTGEQLVVGNEKSHLVSIFDLADVLALDGAEEPGEFASLPHADVAVTSPACVAFG
jgi:6-phosphogluconolactonase (cycloisomerase 2 family)